MDLVDSLIRDEGGASAVEYGLVAAMVALAFITVLEALGANLAASFGFASDDLEAANES